MSFEIDRPGLLEVLDKVSSLQFMAGVLRRLHEKSPAYRGEALT